MVSYSSKLSLTDFQILRLHWMHRQLQSSVVKAFSCSVTAIKSVQEWLSVLQEHIR